MIGWEFCEVVVATNSARAYFYTEETTTETSNLALTRRFMANLGFDGWEPVSAVALDGLLYYFFKRPLPETEE